MFYIQLQDDKTLSATDATILERIKEHNWLRQKDAYEYRLLTYDELQNEPLDVTAVPSGSIEFCEACIEKAYGIAHIPHLLIPSPINIPKFTGRKTAIAKNKTELLSLYSQWQTKKLFIKSASVLKGSYTGNYSEGAATHLPDDTYFVSESIHILSEWRLFVFRHNILDIRFYKGNPWLMPDETTAHKIVSSYAGAPSAYTLDLAVAEFDSFPVRRTVVIELHHFLACGLYGCESPRLLNMLMAATQDVTNRRISPTIS